MTRLVPACATVTVPLDHGGPSGRHFDPFPVAALADSVPARFFAIADREPERLAITDGVTHLTYRDVADQVRRIAGGLCARAAGNDGPIAILLPHGITFPIAMLSVLLAGRGYVPLDTSFPSERNLAILQDAGVAAVLTDAAHIDTAAALAVSVAPVIEMAELAAVPASTLPVLKPDDLAYIIYTSGSTGRPKGVYQNHRNLLHDVLQYTNAIHITPDDRLSLFYSPSVNGAIRDIYSALLNGASLHVLPVKDTGPDRLLAFIRTQRLTIYHSVPIIFRHLVAQMVANNKIDTVRLAYLAGDRMDHADVAAFRQHFDPSALLFTGVGSTEVATIYAHRFITADTPLVAERVAVGHRIPDREFLLLDENGNHVNEGEIGEIVVRSRYISLGYWRNAEATALAFACDLNDPTLRIYRTGDLGRIGKDGLLSHLGRKDHQIKLRGHRIEISEIETTIKLHDAVAEAAVLLRDPEGSATLVAYVVTHGSPPLDTDRLRAFLRERLPPYMVPSRIVRVGSLPLLANFKIDRAAVARLDAAAARPSQAATANEPIARSFAEILQIQVGEDDDFFVLGGDSMSAIRLVLELEQALAVPVPRGLVHIARTPRQVARWLAETRPALLRQVTPLRPATKSGPTLLILSGIDGTCADVLPWLSAWPSDWAVCGVVDRAAVSPSEPADNMAELAEQAVEAIQAAGFTGPFHLLGYSFGGRLAYETALRLRAEGEHVAFLGMIDTPSWVESDLPPSPSPIVQARRRAIMRHRVQSCDVPVTFFRTVGSWPDKPDDYFWARSAKHLDAIRLPGMHQTFGQGRNLTALAQAFHTALESRGCNVPGAA